MRRSLDCVDKGSKAEFIEALRQDVFSHPATRHPYLDRLAEGSLPCVDQALRDFAFQYSFYSSCFADCLADVAEKVPNKLHQALILENLSEEQGKSSAKNIEERPHSEIFRDFKTTIGVDKAFEADQRACEAVLQWRDNFQKLCSDNSFCVGLGAMGFGTELVVPKIYSHIILAIEAHSSFEKAASHFFRLHVDCDDDHSDVLVDVISDYAETYTNRKLIRNGAVKALDLRTVFWDAMLTRAMSSPTKKSLVSAA